jgi:hypothetical protein
MAFTLGWTVGSSGCREGEDGSRWSGAGRADSTSEVLWLLLGVKVVDVPMAHTLTFVMLSSLHTLFFLSLKNELHFSNNVRA